jgi:uncharacterized protein (UPF0297 family)
MCNKAEGGLCAVLPSLLAESVKRELSFMHEKTVEFSRVKDTDDKMKSTLEAVYAALVEKGYNPINQIVGYLLSEDPTYITTYNNARSLIRHIDRDELLQEIVRSYLNVR